MGGRPSSKIIRRMELYIFPWLGTSPIRDIKALELLNTLRRIETKGAKETAHRALQICGRIMRYAVATGRAERDVSRDLMGALAPVKTQHRAAITEPTAVGVLLRTIDRYSGSFVTQCALRLAPLVFVRPGELRRAEWIEIDLEKQEWRIPAARMKMRSPHLVPLSNQAVAVLREFQPLTGDKRFVFPGAVGRDRSMSDNTVNVALRRLGYSKDENDRPWLSRHGIHSAERTRVSAKALLNRASTLDLATASTTAVTARQSCCCSPAGPSAARTEIFAPRRSAGKTISAVSRTKDSAMPLTRDFKETIMADLRRDRAYRAAYLAEAIESMHSGEFSVGKRMLRNYINGTLGFDELSKAVGSPAKSLMRMLSDNSNPHADKLFDILGHLQHVDRVKIQVVPVTAPRTRRAGRSVATE